MHIFQGLRARYPNSVRFAIVFLVGALIYLVTGRFRALTAPTPINNHVVLADALLHGHLWVATSPMAWVDCVMFMGKCYVIEGPMPAVVMLPLVALFGLHTNQSLLCIVAAALGLAAFDRLLGEMRISASRRLAMDAFVGFGTVYWWCTVNPNVWMFAHVVCVMFLLFGLAEWYGKRRMWIVGLCFAGAALTRSPAVLAVVPFFVWAWLDGGPRSARSFVLGFAPLIVLDVAYNLARWHVPYDIGYTLWYHQDTAGSHTGYPLGLQYAAYNLYSFFILAPAFSNYPPWISLTDQGVALTFTSPALILALAAPRSRESLTLWASALLVAIPNVLYYVNGYAQFGMRHSLDFTPFLACLVARGLDRRPDLASYALIGFSVIANAFGVGEYQL